MVESGELRTFFDLVKEHPETQKSFADYKNDVATLVTEQFDSIAGLGTIVSEYLFGLEKKEKESADAVLCEITND